jgi:hypothetical protein
MHGVDWGRRTIRSSTGQYGLPQEGLPVLRYHPWSFNLIVQDPIIVLPVGPFGKFQAYLTQRGVIVTYYSLADLLDRRISQRPSQGISNG